METVFSKNLPIKMSKLHKLLNKPLGEILQEAGLISSAQLELALMNQSQMDQSPYFRLKLGEILALRGWIKKETADFFAEKLQHIISAEEKKRLGDYLLASALLEKEQIEAIVAEQEKIGLKFGSVAVHKGWLKQSTLDFFLEYFTSEYQQPPSEQELISMNGQIAQS
jgi:hypothetical protein